MAKKKKKTKKKAATPQVSGVPASQPATSDYSTTSMAQGAVDMLRPIVDGLKVNNLDAYVTPQLRQDFIRDENYIRGRMDDATRAAYDVNRAQAIQEANAAEDTNLANTRNAIAEMRRNLVGSGSSGANVGAANATALQALLGLGQQNAQTTTEGMNAINDVNREQASKMAENAVNAINTANEATGRMYDAATSAYGSDRSYAAQGAAEAIGQLASAADTAASQERINNATNATNASMNNTTAGAQVKSAKLGQKSTITNVDGGKKKSKKKKKG